MQILVESAITLSDKQKQALKEKVLAQLNQPCEFKFTVDENLIAGLRLIMPGKIVDQTISARLAMLQDQLAQ